MKTEFDFGFDTAKWMSDNELNNSAVDVEKMILGTSSIPDEDYCAIVRFGIENPDSLKYWQGFNSYFTN
jgi:hypothetical protein